jgi:hypothetical protein
MALDEVLIERLRSGMQDAAKGGRVTESQVDVVRRALIGESFRSNPRGGRAAAVAEATAVLGQVVGPKGRVKASPASRAQQKATKKARKLAAKRSTRRTGESLKARVARPGVREALGAAQAPKGAPGAAGEDSGLLAALSAGRPSPFWQMPGSATSVPVKAGKGARPVPSAAGLAAMSTDQLRAYAAGALQDAADASGFASPIWQDSRLRSPAQS